MLAEYRYKTGIGVAAGLLLIVVGRIIRKLDVHNGGGGVVALAGFCLFVWGCSQYAKAKGYSGWWGLLGLLSIIGLVVLWFFRDCHRDSESKRPAMPSKELLRTLIIAEICITVVGVAVSIYTEASLPEPLQIYLEEEAEAEITVRDKVMIAIAIPLLILVIVSRIGLFFFWRPARILYAVTMVVGLLATPFFGPYVDTGWGTMFEEAAIMISGVILALIYFSPLKDFFEKPMTV